LLLGRGGERSHTPRARELIKRELIGQLCSERRTMEQLSLLKKTETKQYDVDKGTVVKLGRHTTRVFTRRRNKEAIERLKEILSQLEGKDVLISQHCDYWWYQDLRLKKLGAQWFHDNSGLVLWGTKGAEVRILWLKFLYNFREQYYGNGKPYYLLDFWNGFRNEPLNNYYRGGYQCLQIRPAR